MMADDTTDTSEAPLLIVYTSGTTGRPKGAVLPQRAMRSNARMSQHAYSLQSSDVVLNVLPLFHVGGLNIHPVPALISGATVILHRSFDPAAALDAIAQASVTLMNSVPTILGAMVTHENWAKTDLSSMRLFSIGSTDVPVALIRRCMIGRFGGANLWRDQTAPSQFTRQLTLPLNHWFHWPGGV